MKKYPRLTHPMPLDSPARVAKTMRRRIFVLRSCTDDDCPICLDPLLHRRCVHLKCGHAMHLACEKQLRERHVVRCPLCRTVVFRRSRRSVMRNLSEWLATA